MKCNIFLRFCCQDQPERVYDPEECKIEFLLYVLVLHYVIESCFYGGDDMLWFLFAGMCILWESVWCMCSVHLRKMSKHVPPHVCIAVWCTVPHFSLE